MRLLLVTKDFPPDVGGIQSYCFELGQVFAQRCEAFAVVAPRVAGCREVDRTLPYAVHRVPCTRDSFAALVAAHLPRIRRHMQFEVVLGAQWQSALAALALRRHLGSYGVFAAVHGRELLTRHFAAWPFGPRLFSASRRNVLAELDGLLPISHYSLALLRELEVPYQRAAVIPNGCNPTRFCPRDRRPLRARLGLGERPTLLSMCRLVPRKGVDTVIRALPAIAEKVPDVVYLVAGEGEDRPRLEALAERCGVAGRVRFLGRVSDPARVELYGACDLFVLAAREERPDVEGFGLVFLEASACARPSVGTYSGGIPDAVREGETGLLVPPEQPQAFAEAVVSLLRDPERARAMGEAGRRWAQGEASWPQVGARILEQLRQWREADRERSA